MTIRPPSLSLPVISSIHGNYHEVVPGLYQGSVPTRHQQQFYEPFDRVVLCTDPQYAYLWTFAPDAESREVIVASFDYTSSGLTTLLAHASAAAEDVRNSKRVLVVCASGIYRSTLFVALVRMYLGTPLDSVLEDVVATHSGWSAGATRIFADAIRNHLKDTL